MNTRLGCEPGPAPGCDVGPLLLGCMRCFFEGHAVTIEAAPDGAGSERGAVLDTRQVGQLDQTDILLRRRRRQDQPFNAAMRAGVAVLRLGLDAARRIHGRRPADSTYGRHTEPLGRTTVGHAP